MYWLCTIQMGYLEHDLVAQNPFTVLDEGGVGSMIQSAVVRAQRSGTNVKVHIEYISTVSKYMPV